MPLPAARRSPLSLYRAFVVQFGAETDVGHGRRLAARKEVMSLNGQRVSTRQAIEQ